jgi:integrase
LENQFVFFGSSAEAPIPRKTVETEFAKTCHAIGIPEPERRRRRLTFHGWRHWYEAQYRGKIDDHVLREQMRHKSLKMTERYSHVTEEQAQLVAKVAAGLF